MTNRDIALDFLDRFCAGDVDGLEPLLEERLRFRGPLHRSDTRAAYLQALRADPPQPATFRVIAMSGDADTVAVFYDYEKPAGTVRVAQLFAFVGDRIGELVLVFDPTAVT